MAAKAIVPGVHQVSLGMVNVFLIEGDEGLTLIDAGISGSAGRILGAVRSLGREPGEVRNILITHLHADHVGGLAELRAATGARVWAHPADAVSISTGQAMRAVEPAPGILSWLVCNLAIRPSMKRTRAAAPRGVTVEGELHDGDVLPFAGGLQALHMPGHSAGHTVFLWPHQGGVLFLGDAASNMFGLGYPLLFEDRAEGERSLARLAALDFETACFAHGRAIVGGAAARLRAKWG